MASFFFRFLNMSVTNNKVDQETNCNLLDEFTEADEKLIERANLTSEQLKLKEQDVNAFWKSVSETIRANLNDALQDNEEVIFSTFFSCKNFSSMFNASKKSHALYNLMKAETKDLTKECARLEKLTKEAQEIVNEYKKML